MNAPAFPITNLPNRTEEDYRADLVRRFGYLPSSTELAARESAAMRSRLGGYHNPIPSPDARSNALDNENCQAVLAVLVEPMTRLEVCAKTGMNPLTAKGAFHRLQNAGLIRRHSMADKHAARWERVE